MVLALAEKITDYLEEKEIITEDKEIYKLGFALNISTGFSFLVVFLIGVYCGNWINSILYIMTFALLRTRVGGYHCKSYFTCDASYISIFVLYEWLSTLTISLEWYVLIAVGTMAMLWVFAPIGHINKPLDEYQLRYGKRNSRIVIGILASLLAILYVVNGGLAKTLCFVIVVNGILFLLGKKELSHEKNNKESI